MVITSTHWMIQIFDLFKFIQKIRTISNSVSKECNIVIIEVFCFIVSE